MKKRAIFLTFLMSVATLFAFVWLRFYRPVEGVPERAIDPDEHEADNKPLLDRIEYHYERLLKEVEVTAPAEAYRPKRDPRELRYDVRVAYFHHREQAEALLAQLKKRDLVAQIIPRIGTRSERTEERITGYQVVIPKILSRSKANAIMDHLADLKLQPQLIPLQIEPP